MKWLIFLFLSVPSLSWASPYVCFTGQKMAWDNQGEAVAIFETARWNPSCEALENTAVGLKATSLVFSGVGFGLACTGVGLPATVWLQGASIGTSVLGLIVGELPCDSSTKDAQVKVLAEEAVCAELERQGIVCSLRR